MVIFTKVTDGCPGANGARFLGRVLYTIVNGRTSHFLFLPIVGHALIFYGTWALEGTEKMKEQWSCFFFLDLK